MNRKTLPTLRNTFITVLMLACVTSLFAQFGGGSGTPSNPYIISSPSHLNNIRTHLDDCYRQTADINLNVSPYNQGTGWEPIGGDYPQFSGTYDGQEHTISNLFINRPDTQCQALFGRTWGAHLSNIYLQNINISVGDNSGGLVGASSSTIFNNCTVTGTITSTYPYIGGLVGSMYQSQVSKCSSEVNITGNDMIGGLVGQSYRSSISCSQASGNIDGGSGDSGGLVGVNDHSTIVYSHASGDVSGSFISFRFGGLVGSNSNNSAIQDCYARGSIIGDMHVGGLVGSTSKGNIQNCYSTGNVLGNPSGGLIGYNAPATTVSASYWNTQTSGLTTSGGGEGRTTTAMTFPYAANTYVGWDMASVWSADVSHSTNAGYPYLQIQDSPGMVISPEFSHDPGTYTTTIQVGISSATPNASIYYTLDGSEPTESSILYTDDVPVTHSRSFRAKAFKTGWVPSLIVSAAYIIEPIGIDDETDLAEAFLNNYPNPFNPTTTIRFELKKANWVNLRIYNICGQLVKTLINGVLSSGVHSVEWDGTDAKGIQVASGIYLSRFVSDGQEQTRKMMLVK